MNGKGVGSSRRVLCLSTWHPYGVLGAGALAAFLTSCSGPSGTQKVTVHFPEKGQTLSLEGSSASLPLHVGVSVSTGAGVLARLGLDKVTNESSLDIPYGDVAITADMIALKLPPGTTPEAYCQSRNDPNKSGGGGGGDEILYATSSFRVKVDKNTDSLTIPFGGFATQKMMPLAIKITLPNGTPAAGARVFYKGPVSQMLLRDPCESKEIADTTDEHGIVVTDFPLDLVKNGELGIQVVTETQSTHNAVLKVTPGGDLLGNLFVLALAEDGKAPAVGTPQGPAGDFDGNEVSNQAQWQAGQHPARFVTLEDSDITLGISTEPNNTARIFLQTAPWDRLHDAQLMCSLDTTATAPLQGCETNTWGMVTTVGNYTVRLRVRDGRTGLWLSPELAKPVAVAAASFQPPNSTTTNTSQNGGGVTTSFMLPTFIPSSSSAILFPSGDPMQRDMCSIKQTGTIDFSNAFGTNITTDNKDLTHWGIFGDGLNTQPATATMASTITNDITLTSTFTGGVMAPWGVTGSQEPKSATAFRRGFEGDFTVNGGTTTMYNGAPSQDRFLTRNAPVGTAALDEWVSAMGGMGLNFGSSYRLASRLPSPNRQVGMEQAASSCLLCKTGNEDWGLMAAGPAHTCQVGADDLLRCWGNNTFGQFGDGTTLGSNVANSVNGIGGTSTPLAQLTSGGYFSSGGTPPALAASHTCGLFYTDSALTTSTVKCWGSNNAGQLGKGNPVSPPVPPEPSPQTVVGMENQKIISISAGAAHTCAVKIEEQNGTPTGNVYCWGSNKDSTIDFPKGIGRTGSGTGLDFYSPTPVTGVSDAIQVVAGREHSCALLRGGSVKCWGNATNSVVVGGTTGTSGFPTDVLGLTSNPVKQLTAGDRHTCALTQMGEVKCWGNNSSSQLGLGNTTTASSPPSVLNSVLNTDTNMPLNNIVHIAAGGNFTCAITKDARLYCWGSLHSAVTPFSKAASVGTQTNPDTDLNNVTGVTVGLEHVCVVTRPKAGTAAGVATHRTFCWGKKEFGRLGAFDNSASIPDAAASPLLNNNGAVSTEAATQNPLQPRQRVCNQYQMSGP